MTSHDQNNRLAERALSVFVQYYYSFDWILKYSLNQELNEAFIRRTLHSCEYHRLDLLFLLFLLQQHYLTAELLFLIQSKLDCLETIQPYSSPKSFDSMQKLRLFSYAREKENSYLKGSLDENYWRDVSRKMLFCGTKALSLYFRAYSPSNQPASLKFLLRRLMTEIQGKEMIRANQLIIAHLREVSFLSYQNGDVLTGRVIDLIVHTLEEERRNDRLSFLLLWKCLERRKKYPKLDRVWKRAAILAAEAIHYDLNFDKEGLSKRETSSSSSTSSASMPLIFAEQLKVKDSVFLLQFAAYTLRTIQRISKRLNDFTSQILVKIYHAMEMKKVHLHSDKFLSVGNHLHSIDTKNLDFQSDELTSFLQARKTFYLDTIDSLCRVEPPPATYQTIPDFPHFDECVDYDQYFTDLLIDYFHKKSIIENSLPSMHRRLTHVTAKIIEQFQASAMKCLRIDRTNADIIVMERTFANQLNQWEGYSSAMSSFLTMTERFSRLLEQSEVVNDPTDPRSIQTEAIIAKFYAMFAQDQSLSIGYLNITLVTFFSTELYTIH